MTPITWYLYGRSGGAKKAAEEIGVKGSMSGDIASFSDGADDVAVKSLVASITPVQSGSGDPSPTNIRPISGRTGMTVTRAGKNIFKTTLTTRTVNGTTFTVNADGSITVSGTPTAQTRVPIKMGLVSDGKNAMVFSSCDVPTNVRYYLKRVYKGETTYPTISPVSNFTLLGAKYYDLHLEVNTTFDGTQFIAYPQLEFGTSATAYEPYAGQTYPITWETEAGTVYGGTLDMVSGVLTVTHAVGELSENWYWYKGNTQPTGKSVISTTTAIGYVDAMSHYKLASAQYIVQMGAFTFLSTSATALHICASDTDSMTADDFKQYIVAQRTAGTPIQIYYRLATPQTYQLTPTEVRTLLGGNNIYTDAGDVSVEYVADTKLYIDNKVAELQALILEN